MDNVNGKCSQTHPGNAEIDGINAAIGNVNSSLRDTLGLIRSAAGAEDGFSGPSTERAEVLDVADAVCPNYPLHLAIDWHWLNDQVVRRHRAVRLPFIYWGEFIRDEWTIAIRQYLGALNANWFHTADALTVVPRNYNGIDLEHPEPRELVKRPRLDDDLEDGD